jgi:hypothetical protein
VTTRDIRPSLHHTICDVCGRTLLRGEHADVYLDGGERRWVCDLCVPRALEDGWVREGTAPPLDSGEGARERRRSLRGWFRSRRRAMVEDGETSAPAQGEALPYTVYSPRSRDPLRDSPRETRRESAREQRREPPREPRHVHAVPTSPDQKVSAAIKAFNGSEHTRTVAGVARSLGQPEVTVRPSDTQPALVWVVAAWELCWYRYEVDLADEMPSVRVAARGTELEELDPIEREDNARANEEGALALR